MKKSPSDVPVWVPNSVPEVDFPPVSDPPVPNRAHTELKK